jgi:carboxymethylenebutenolidase
MRERHCVLLVLLVVTSTRAFASDGPPESLTIRSGDATLHALLWRPEGHGPFPAVLIDHGSGRTREQLARLGPYEQQAVTVCPVFNRHGYVCLFMFRRGVGPSSDAGKNAIDLMDGAFARDGQEARNTLQLQLLEHRELDDAAAALAALRARSDVDSRRVSLVGHSFGASLTLLLAEREPDVRAIVLFSTAGYSWDRSPELRIRLLAALPHITAPVLLMHAANDYSINPGKALDERLAQLGKVRRLKIYPPIGTTPDEGHDLPLHPAIWESDVFAFLRDADQR